MTEMLRLIYQDAVADPRPYYHLNHRRVEMWRRQMEQTPEALRPQLRYFYAYELLNAGEVDAAIGELQALLPRADRGGYVLNRKSKPYFDLLTAAYLRQGIQQNYLNPPSPDAYLLPLSERGLFERKQAAYEAISLGEEMLTYVPDDLQTRWLVNLAYMMLGRYPGDVPDDWRIPGLQAPAEARLPRFRNVAPALGVATGGMAGGVSLDDFDGDGFLDLFITSYGLNDQARLFLANGRGGFLERTEEAGLTGITGGLNTIHADYDNDGDIDLLVLRGAWLGDYGAHPNSLLRNNGDGTFTDVATVAGLLSFHPTQTAAWGDFNLDGWLDLFVGNETNNQYQGMGARQADPGANAPVQEHPSELFLNNGDGTFTDVAPQMGLDLRTFVKGVTWGDVNNDGWPDLFVSVRGAPNRLYLNHGGTGPHDWRFDEVGTAAGVDKPLLSFPCWFWDFNNDGWEDLFVASFDQQNVSAVIAAAREFLDMDPLGDLTHVFRNNGDGTFTNVAATLGLDRSFHAMSANFGDLNNDGYPDLYLGTGAPEPDALIPNRMFLNREGTRFDDVTFDGGFGHLQKGHGIAFGDVDRDGDQDIYIVMGGAVEGDAFANALFENPTPSPEHAWVMLRLEGRRANRSALGARIRITVTDHEGRRRVVFATVSTGGTFGASTLQQEIGLGPTERIDTLRITWPIRQPTVDVYTGLAVNRYYEVVEGGGIRPLAWESVRLQRGDWP